MSYKGVGFKSKNLDTSNKKISFSKYVIKKDDNVRIVFSIFTLLIIFLLSLILPKSIKAYSEGEYQNHFYFNAINNTISVIKSSKMNEKYVNNDNSMRFIALSLLGIDVSDPISIITKEAAYLSRDEIASGINEGKVNNKNEDIKTLVLNPFKLDDKQIIKTSEKSEGVDQVATLYNPALKKTLNKAKPEVLIYHSHTSEAYSASSNEQSMDVAKNVCAVGEVIAEELEKRYGIAVIHDKTVHDKGDYNGAYKKSGVTLDKYLKEYGNFKLIIDLHRDSVVKSAVTTKINGEGVARFMFVVTQKNPRYAKQKKLIDAMIKTSNKLFPDLLRGNEIFAYEWGIGYYNQNRSDNAVLIEVGAYSNTIDEVKNTGRYLARIIAEQINGKSE
jgi:stage II sporulation protein P